MGQAECLELLEKEKRWMTTKEVCEKLKSKCQNRSLQKIYEQGYVEKRMIRVKTVWGSKIKCEWKAKE